jgi:hypothetical protein
LFAASVYGHCDVLKCLLSSGADINLLDKGGRSPLISAPELSKHLTTSQCSSCDAINNGDCPRLLRTLIPAPELSKLLLNAYLVLVQISICVIMVDNHHCLQLHTMGDVMLLNVYLNLTVSSL